MDPQIGRNLSSHSRILASTTKARQAPRGVRHNPVAAAECLVLLIERKSTLHSGNEVTERTRSIAQQLGG